MIGFCCKFLQDDGKPDPRYVTRGTTLTWLQSHSEQHQFEKMEEIVRHNLDATLALVKHLGNQPMVERIVRLSSDILPFFSHPHTSKFYQYFEHEIEKKLYEIGNAARYDKVRLSFHPGQFVVLGSDQPEVVDNSIREIEAHATIAKMMGYEGVGNSNPYGFHINIHPSGVGGIPAISESFRRLTLNARNLVTFENDEFSYGLDDCLVLSMLTEAPVVLDIHHHWIFSKGEHISINDPRVEKVHDSWKRRKPIMHYSLSKESLIPNYPRDVLPDYDTYVKAGYGPGKLRAHSDYYWNNAANQWVASFLGNFDIEAEVKMKNLAVSDLRHKLSF